MSKIHKIVDANTGEVIERPYTEEEIKNDELQIKLIEKELAAEKKQQAQRQALLSRLGITEEQAKLLLS